MQLFNNICLAMTRKILFDYFCKAAFTVKNDIKSEFIVKR